MKLVLLLVISIFFLSLTHVAYHNVKYVYDGDTILLGNGDKVRYLGINAPEIDCDAGKSETMAYAAREFNHRLVSHARVRMEYDIEKRDGYGRLLAYLFLENGDMVNALLVQKGLAHVLFIKPNIKYKDLFLNCQRRAMKEKLGIWCRLPRSEEEFYFGNRKSHRFHRAACPFGRKISPRDLVRFKSLYDAFWEGYAPCRRCKPETGPPVRKRSDVGKQNHY